MTIHLISPGVLLPQRRPLVSALLPSRSVCAPQSAPAPAPAGPGVVSVREGRDALVVRLRAGDTLYGLARRFAADTDFNGRLDAQEIRAYLDDVLAANARLDAHRLPVGQAVLLPVTSRAAYAVTAALAVQKHLASQPAGTAKPEWAGLETAGGPLESLRVSAPTLSGKRTSWLVFDDASGKAPQTYRVWSEAAFRRRFPELVGR